MNDGTFDSASAYMMTIDVTDAPAPVCADAQLRRPARNLVRYGDGGGVLVHGELLVVTDTNTLGLASSLLPSADFSIGSNNYAIAGLSVEKTGDLLLNVATNTQLTATEKAALRLHVCDEDLDFSVAVNRMDDTRYGWTATLDWSDPVVTRTVYLSLPANRANDGASRRLPATSVGTGRS